MYVIYGDGTLSALLKQDSKVKIRQIFPSVCLVVYYFGNFMGQQNFFFKCQNFPEAAVTFGISPFQTWGLVPFLRTSIDVHLHWCKFPP